MLNQGRTKTFSELNRLNLKEFLNELNIGFHKDGFLNGKNFWNPKCRYDQGS